MAFSLLFPLASTRGPRKWNAVGMGRIHWNEGPAQSLANLLGAHTAYLEHTLRRTIYEKHRIPKIIERQPINGTIHYGKLPNEST
jgi:hypothetical protein